MRTSSLRGWLLLPPFFFLVVVGVRQFLVLSVICTTSWQRTFRGGLYSLLFSEELLGCGSLEPLPRGVISCLESSLEYLGIHMNT